MPFLLELNSNVLKGQAGSRSELSNHANTDKCPHHLKMLTLRFIFSLFKNYTTRATALKKRKKSGTFVQISTRHLFLCSLRSHVQNLVLINMQM